MPNLLAEYAPRDAWPCFPVPELAPVTTSHGECDNNPGEQEWVVHTDDATAVALCDHLFGCVLVAKEGATKVDGEEAIEVIRSSWQGSTKSANALGDRQWRPNALSTILFIMEIPAFATI
jgi:hypothetical protein